MNQSGIFRLDGRVAFLSGAAGHLGQKMAEGLAEAGATVILNGRDASRLEAVSASLRSRGLASEIDPFDITDPVASGEGLQRIERKHGKLDVIVNNAYAGRTSTHEHSTAEDLELAYRIAVVGPFEFTRKAVPLLSRSAERLPGGASVINISTMYALVSPDPGIYGDSGMNSPPFYGAAKAGLLQWTRYAACHLAHHRIRVNAIAPGPFPPPRFNQEKPEFMEKLRAKSPMGRVGTAEELKGPVLFLASDASSYVTGITLPVDGGWTAW